MPWECECGVSNKDNSEMCQGCGFTKEQTKQLMEDFSSPEKIKSINKIIVGDSLRKLKLFFYSYLLLWLIVFIVKMSSDTDSTFASILIFSVVIAFIVSIWGCALKISKIAGIIGKNKTWWFIGTICFQPISVIISFIRINKAVEYYLGMIPYKDTTPSTLITRKTVMSDDVVCDNCGGLNQDNTIECVNCGRPI